jgi:hypothetical protein
MIMTKQPAKSVMHLKRLKSITAAYATDVFFLWTTTACGLTIVLGTTLTSLLLFSVSMLF